MIPILAVVFTMTVSIPGTPPITDHTTMPEGSTLHDCEVAAGTMKIFAYFDMAGVKGAKVRMRCEVK